MKAFSVFLVVCGLPLGFGAPAARVSRLGLALGRQGLASTSIGIGSAATNMATGLASQTLGAFGGIPILGLLAQVGKAAAETGNNFAQMGMGIGQLAVNGFGGLGNAAQQQLAGQMAAQQQIAAQFGTQQQQQLAAQLEAQQQLTSQAAAQQQLAAAQLQMSQALTQQQADQQDGNFQQQANGSQQTESFQDVLGSPELDSWWNPLPPQAVYIGM